MFALLQVFIHRVLENAIRKHGKTGCNRIPRAFSRAQSEPSDSKTNVWASSLSLWDSGPASWGANLCSLADLKLLFCTKSPTFWSALSSANYATDVCKCSSESSKESKIMSPLPFSTNSLLIYFLLKISFLSFSPPWNYISMTGP